MMDAVLNRIRNEAPEPAARSPASAHPVIPDPLRSYLGGDLESLQWKMVAPRVHQVQIETADRRSKARLLRFHSGLMSGTPETRSGRTVRLLPPKRLVSVR